MSIRTLSLVLLSVSLLSFPALADQLITNGGFEAGLAGWSVTNVASGGWFAATGTSSPVSGHPTAGPAGGTMYAVTDQTGPGVHALIQSFVVPIGQPSVKLSFDMFVNDWDGGPICGPGLNIGSGAVECGRVDILTAGAGAFDTGAGVVDNLFLGADAVNGISHPYTAYSFDLTGILTPGMTYQLRFAEADNQGFFNQGVDNVSLLSTAPEPESIFLLGTLVAGIYLLRKRRANATV